MLKTPVISSDLIYSVQRDSGAKPTIIEPKSRFTKDYDAISTFLSLLPKGNRSVQPHNLSYPQGLASLISFGKLWRYMPEPENPS